MLVYSRPISVWLVEFCFFMKDYFALYNIPYFIPSEHYYYSTWQRETDEVHSDPLPSWFSLKDGNYGKLNKIWDTENTLKVSSAFVTAFATDFVNKLYESQLPFYTSLAK